MLTDRAEGLMRISRITKYLIATCTLTAMLVTDMNATDGSIRSAVIPAVIAFLTLAAFGPSWLAWSNTYFRRPWQSAIKLTCVDSVLTAITLKCLSTISPATLSPASPSVLVIAAFTALFLLLNRFLPDAIAAILYHWRSPQRILTIGSEQAIGQIHEQLQQASKLGLIHTHRSSTTTSRDGIRIFDPNELPLESLRLSEIEDIVVNGDSSLAIDHVVFVDDLMSKNNTDVDELRKQCNTLGVPLTVYSTEDSVPPWNNHPIPLSAPTSSRHPCNTLQNPVNQLAKRCIDILISLPVVVFVMPLLCLLVRSIHRRQSPGPLFYRQERFGRNGTKFHILKFRTMHVPAEGQTDIEADPGHRIFRLGAMLRDSRLDEIPQFINVLAGSMSIVGPRAHHAQDRIKFSKIVPHYPMRMQAKPGITGLAQYREYRGRFRRNSVEDRVDCDLTYIATWKLETDALLMVKTARLIGESLAFAALRGWRDSKQDDVKPAVPVEPPSLMPDQRAA